MGKATIVLIGVLLTLPQVAEAAPPAQLHGKSVVISMSEVRVSRPVGGGQTSSSTAQMQFSVYVSDAGRPFVRSHRTLTTGKRGTESKDIDTAPGGGSIGVSTASGVQFSGNAMTVTMAMNSGARRITVSFDGAFSSCSASVINAKEGGRSMVIRSRYTGQNREVLSTNMSVNGCSIRSGNVFAGQ
jgi:hypothetical protein